MVLTDEEIKRLNRLFDNLWSCRGGVKGSWGASSFRYHPTFIRRNGLLLSGECDWSSLYVISPADAKMHPVYGDSRCSMSVFPIIEEGELIRINRDDDGPWWDLVRQELPLMEAELKASGERARQDQQRAEDELIAKRQAKLDAARMALS